MADPDPSKALAKEVYETFAQGLSKGRTLADCYGAAKNVRVTRKNEPSLKVSGFRLSKRPEIANRVAWLISDLNAKRAAEIEAMAVPEVFTSASILDLILETTDVLEDCYAALLKTDLPEIRRRQYFSILSSHLARQGSLIEDNQSTSVTKVAAGDDLRKIRWCAC